MYEVGIVATVVTSIALVAVGIVVAISKMRTRDSAYGAWFFVFTCMMLAIWLMANVLSDIDYGRSLAWVKVSFASVALGVTSLLLFVNRFPAKKYVSPLHTLTPIMFLTIILLLTASPYMIPEVVFDGNVATVIPGRGYILFVLFIISVLLLTLYRLIRITRSSRRYRAQGQLILGGIVATASVALVTNLLLPLVIGNNNLYWLASVSTLGFVGATAYAIVKEGLFDVRLAVMRSVVYVATLATIIGIYYALVSFIAHSVFSDHGIVDAAFSPIVLLPALIFILTFNPVKNFFDSLTNGFFFKNSYKSDVFYAEFGQILASTTDLHELLERASHKIAETFKAEQVFFQIYNPSEDHRHIVVGTRGHSKLPIQDTVLLDEYCNSEPAHLLQVEAIANIKIKRMLRSHKVTLAMPFRHDGRIIGYLMLGEHLSSNYTNRDFTVLLSNSNSMIIAIQNALSLHEVRALNATLQQRIDVATKELRSSNAQLKHIDEVKDEFMSMASHQLRTPLTSIKGYLSMVLDGDMGKISPQQEKVLLEAFNSSERMVHLIADFLNVSRLQTGKFVIEKSVIDFNALVEQEVEDLTVMAKGRKLELVLQVPKAKLFINADRVKLREVITNFVDNAIFYSRPATKIVIKVRQDGGALLFTVADTGIGVPKKEQSKLFGKFFRATNARKQRPDGTGVGLYLARKVVMAHGGKVLFESVEGKGSVFGFRIPLAQLPNQANNTNNN